MWERYCRGVSAIVFVVDSAVPLPSGKQPDADEAPKSSAAESAPPTDGPTPVATTDPSSTWGVATEELHALMSRPMLAGVPLLVLATKNDVEGAVSAEDVIRVM